MRKLVLALGVVFATAFTAGSASAFPGSSGLIDALATQNMVQDVQYCRRGNLLVPGPHQRLLPGRLGLRLDQLLSFGARAPARPRAATRSRVAEHSGQTSAAPSASLTRS